MRCSQYFLAFCYHDACDSDTLREVVKFACNIFTFLAQAYPHVEMVMHIADSLGVPLP